MKHFVSKHSLALALVVYFVFLALSALVSASGIYGGEMGGEATGRSVAEVPAWGFALFVFLTGIIEEFVFCAVIFVLLRNGFKGAPFGSEANSAANEEGEENSRHTKTEADRNAAAVTAILFGFAHLSLSLGFGMAALKVVQAGLFSYTMVGLFVLIMCSLRRSLIECSPTENVSRETFHTRKMCGSDNLYPSVSRETFSRSARQHERKIHPQTAAILVASLVVGLIHAAFDAIYFLPAFLQTHTLPPYPPQISPDANITILAFTTLLFALTAYIIYRLEFFRKQKD